MRIRHIHIGHWRHFDNIDLQLADETALVCIVGSNGTGKSHLLELIAACAHRLGLIPGIDIPRGDPFHDEHSFALQFHLAEGASAAVDAALAADPLSASWSRILTIESQRVSGSQSQSIRAEGISDPTRSADLATTVITLLRQSENVHFLSLDANRAYPKRDLNVNEFGQAYDTDWSGTEFTRGRSFKSSNVLYDEWLKYCLAIESQSGTRLLMDIRKARLSGMAEPSFIDHFDAYKQSLQEVLPHVIFTGVDPQKRRILFDTTGLALSFDQLSGGEREIAFLIGQVDRFRLRRGLFLLDEPELHLNADLIRAWVTYLSNAVESGQVWLATHSLEAVEAAGTEATFVLERNASTRRVDSAARLDTRPVLAALSRALGTPAFSISQHAFVFVEGPGGIGERERFRRIAGHNDAVRFIEGGSCKEVLRRVSAIRDLASEAQATLRVGGVIDRDFLTDVAAGELQSVAGVFVLPVHEIENMFFHPATLQELLTQNGHADRNALDVIRDAADIRAGGWILQHAMATDLAKNLHSLAPVVKQRAKGLAWSEFDRSRDTTVETIVSSASLPESDAEILRKLLVISATTYSRLRTDPNLWKYCEGKQVLNDVARVAGFAGATDLARASQASWERPEHTIPEELAAMRAYFETL